MKTFLNILFWVLTAFALIQFIPLDRSNPPVEKKEDFVHVLNTPRNVREILRKACYDCHSNETHYPDYAYVAPLSWSIKNHVNKGRRHLNVSIWKTYNADLKKNMLENSIRSVKEYSMPSPAYITQHPEANLTKAERTLLTKYFEELLKSGSY